MNLANENYFSSSGVNLVRSLGGRESGRINYF